MGLPLQYHNDCKESFQWTILSSILRLTINFYAKLNDDSASVLQESILELLSQLFQWDFHGKIDSQQPTNPIVIVPDEWWGYLTPNLVEKIFAILRSTSNRSDFTTRAERLVQIFGSLSSSQPDKLATDSHRQFAVSLLKNILEEAERVSNRIMECLNTPVDPDNDDAALDTEDMFELTLSLSEALSTIFSNYSMNDFNTISQMFPDFWTKLAGFTTFCLTISNQVRTPDHLFTNIMNCWVSVVQMDVTDPQLPPLFGGLVTLFVQSYEPTTKRPMLVDEMNLVGKLCLSQPHLVLQFLYEQITGRYQEMQQLYQTMTSNPAALNPTDALEYTQHLSFLISLCTESMIRHETGEADSIPPQIAALYPSPPISDLPVSHALYQLFCKMCNDLQTILDSSNGDEEIISVFVNESLVIALFTFLNRWINAFVLLDRDKTDNPHFHTIYSLYSPDSTDVTMFILTILSTSFTFLSFFADTDSISTKILTVLDICVTNQSLCWHVTHSQNNVWLDWMQGTFNSLSPSDNAETPLQQKYRQIFSALSSKQKSQFVELAVKSTMGVGDSPGAVGQIFSQAHKNADSPNRNGMNVPAEYQQLYRCYSILSDLLTPVAHFVKSLFTFNPPPPIDLLLFRSIEILSKLVSSSGASLLTFNSSFLTNHQFPFDIHGFVSSFDSLLLQASDPQPLSLSLDDHLSGVCICNEKDLYGHLCQFMQHVSDSKNNPESLCRFAMQLALASIFVEQANSNITHYMSLHLALSIIAGLASAVSESVLEPCLSTFVSSLILPFLVFVGGCPTIPSLYPQTSPLFLRCFTPEMGTPFPFDPVRLLCCLVALPLPPTLLQNQSKQSVCHVSSLEQESFSTLLQVLSSQSSESLQAAFGSVQPDSEYTFYVGDTPLHVVLTDCVTNLQTAVHYSSNPASFSGIPLSLCLTSNATLMNQPFASPALFPVNVILPIALTHFTMNDLFKQTLSTISSFLTSINSFNSLSTHRLHQTLTTTFVKLVSHCLSHASIDENDRKSSDTFVELTDVLAEVTEHMCSRPVHSALTSNKFGAIFPLDFSPFLENGAGHPLLLPFSIDDSTEPSLDMVFTKHPDLTKAFTSNLPSFTRNLLTSFSSLIVLHLQEHLVYPSHLLSSLALTNHILSNMPNRFALLSPITQTAVFSLSTSVIETTYTSTAIVDSSSLRLAFEVLTNVASFYAVYLKRTQPGTPNMIREFHRSLAVLERLEPCLEVVLKAVFLGSIHESCWDAAMDTTLHLAECHPNKMTSLLANIMDFIGAQATTFKWNDQGSFGAQIQSIQTQLESGWASLQMNASVPPSKDNIQEFRSSFGPLFHNIREMAKMT
ncbi:hypothetical protein BLNAU_6280 [Blattamonas nauphoetae]|uniref:Uncharacterized protein n=1 Tax=Blattamonas nauphoetae TaxID=2049346 RepID=A0ABQ9Y4W3_9EUKA|nr:hypothetical protein BLNAU_6280 [Blattamonas nauphoetae]